MTKDSGDFYGFGSLFLYVSFMASHGVSIYEIATALHMKVAALYEACPAFDFYQYEIMPRNTETRRRWNNKEVSLLFKHYPRHGYNWHGWNVVLPYRSRKAIRTTAQILGIKQPNL